jgi:ribosome-associated translation inhibitor RaiA
MQLRVRVLDADVPEETGLSIERKFRIALGRYSLGIDRAQITLSPSPAEGSGSVCRVRVRLRQGPSLEIEQHAEDARTAAAAAAWRLAHRLERRRAIHPAGPSARRFVPR